MQLPGTVLLYEHEVYIYTSRSTLPLLADEQTSSRYGTLLSEPTAVITNLAADAAVAFLRLLAYVAVVLLLLSLGAARSCFCVESLDVTGDSCRRVLHRAAHGHDARPRTQLTPIYICIYIDIPRQFYCVLFCLKSVFSDSEAYGRICWLLLHPSLRPSLA